MSSDNARNYFDFIASAGITEHPGSIEATRELVDRCCITGGTSVLDIGCGVGVTPTYLAQATACRVTGVDLLERMVAQARRRAMAAKVDGRVRFQVADARDLPFTDARFDAVICESVNVFLDDKRGAVSEYVRVVKPGGYVGAAELTWLRPPSAELEHHFSETVHAHPLEDAAWRALLTDAGLTDVVGSARPNDGTKDARGLAARYGWRRTIVGVMRMLMMSITNRRGWAVLKAGAVSMSPAMVDVIGYGVYVGRKAG